MRWVLNTLFLLPVLVVVILPCQLHGTETKELSRWKWEVWEDLPGQNHLKIHLFNVTNPDEVEAGEIPIIREIGPYVFREKREKVSITHHEADSTARYKQVLTYEFVAEESSPGYENDYLTAINIPYISFGTKLAEIPVVGSSNFKAILKAGEKLIRRNEKIEDFLYHGVDAVVYMKIIANLQGGEVPPEFADGRFALFKGRNGTDEGELLVETGESPTSSYGKIQKWKGNSKLENWGGDQCNAINGTDGWSFDPKQMEKLDVQIFIPEFCRSLDYSYAGETEWNGILALKYKFRKEMLEDPRKYPDNGCFCKYPAEDFSNCFKRGVIDVSPCREGAPIALTYPHFFDADEYYSSQVSGLSPSAEMHESYMIIEPKTGTLLEDRKRFQVNMALKPTNALTAFKNLRNMLFPVLWTDKTYTLDADSITELKTELLKHKNDGPSWHSKITAQDKAGSQSASVESNSNPVVRHSNYFSLSCVIVLIITKYLY